MILFFGCTHQGEGKLPKVKTGNIVVTEYNHGSITGAIGGLIEAHGAVVVKYGVCCSTTNNKPTMYNDEGPSADDYDYSHAFGTLSGSQIQPVSREVSLPLDGNTKIYARTYALTADGEEVYGETVTFELEDVVNQPAFLLSRPNGWKLISSSAPLLDWEPDNHTIVFDRTGESYYIGSDHSGSSDHWRYIIDIRSFYNGNSEIIPESNNFEYGINFKVNTPEEQVAAGYSPFYYVEEYFYADIINLTNNELKIRRTNTIQEGDETFTINTIELTYIPAP